MKKRKITVKQIKNKSKKKKKYLEANKEQIKEKEKIPGKNK